MIVISGVLVLVALVLLVIGVVQESLPFVYASIGVSLVSLVFLLLGILQRRKEPLPDAAGSGGAAPVQADRSQVDRPQAARPPVDVSDGVTAVVPTQSAAPTSKRIGGEPPVAASVQDEPTAGGTVLVVSGRPRYHVDGCRYLTGKEAEEVDVLDARDEGFTPCGVCRPDDALAEGPAEDDAAVTSVQPLPTSADLAADDEELYDDEPYDDEPADEEPVAVPVEEPARPARRVAARKISSTAAARGTAAAPAAPAKAPARKRAAAAETAAVTAPAAKAVKAPAKRAAAKTAAPSRAAAAAAEGTPAAASARRAGGVVVIPDRGRFHKAECRYVRGVDGAEVLTKAQAGKQGYEACGVCKP